MPSIDLTTLNAFTAQAAALEAIEPDNDVKSWLGHIAKIADTDREPSIAAALAEIQDQTGWAFLRRLVRRRAVRQLTLAMLFEMTGVD